MAIRISPNRQGREFIDRLEKTSGQNVNKCIQCGYCSGACPMTDHMDAYPRQVTRMAQLGLQGKLENITMYWVCASCQNCGVVCPRGIDLPKVMEALRLMTLRKNRNYVEPSQLPSNILEEYPQIALVAGFRKLTA